MHAWTNKEQWQPIFLAALADGFQVRSASKKAGVSRSHAYDCKREDEVFSKEWDSAVAEALDDDEEELMRRGREGDTTALLARLRAYRQPYRDGAAASAAQIVIPPIVYQERPAT